MLLGCGAQLVAPLAAEAASPLMGGGTRFEQKTV
jgi:hypothetical protein